MRNHHALVRVPHHSFLLSMPFSPVSILCKEQHVMNELHLALMLRVFKALFINTCVLLLLSVDWSQEN